MPSRWILTIAQGDVDVETLEEVLSSDGTDGWDWLAAGGILIGAVLVSILARIVVRRAVRRRADPTIADLAGRVVSWVILIVAFIYALDSLGVAIGPFLGALGIFGIAIAFALKHILENFVAGLLIQVRRPFSYGDQIASGDIEGTVQSVDSRSVTVVTPDGETVRLPSGQVITQPITNHTQHGARRTSIPIGVAYGTDLRSAETVFLEAVHNVDEVRSDPAPEVLLTGFGDSSIDFVVWCWHEPTIADHWRCQSAVAFALDDACRRHDIAIPFPQRVVWSARPDDPPDHPSASAAEPVAER